MTNSLSTALLWSAGILVLAGGRPADAGDKVVTSDETFTVDAVHSSVLFRVTHMGVGPFWGRFSDVRGSVTLPQDGEGLTLNLEVPIAGVDTGSSKLDENLQSEDFFHASKYPSALFKSRTARKTSDGTYRVSGDLTIHGTTQTIEVDVRVAGPADTVRGRRCGIETEFVLKRGAFGMKYGAAGGMIGDDVRLIVALEAAAGTNEGARTERAGTRLGSSVPDSGTRRGASRRMMERIQSMDKDGDGKIERREVPDIRQRLFKSLDANGDGVADEKEIEAFRKRRGGPAGGTNQAPRRDPVDRRSR